jgi:hypothetical protein
MCVCLGEILFKKKKQRQELLDVLFFFFLNFYLERLNGIRLGKGEHLRGGKRLVFCGRTQVPSPVNTCVFLEALQQRGRSL